MPNLFHRFTQRLRSQQQKSRSPQKLKAPRTEQLEQRMLLTVSDLAAIQGRVLDDLGNDGITVDDLPLENASLQLYRDGGDLIFDGGVGDDVFQGSASTIANGTFRFEGLTDGRYYVEQTAVPGLVQRSGENIVTVTVSPTDVLGSNGNLTIDSFNSPGSGQSNTATGSGNFSRSAINAPGAIGGERDLSVEIQSGVDSASSAANIASSGQLVFSADSGVVARHSIVWDGSDGTAAALNHTGLGGIDLTNGGTNTALRLRAGASVSGVNATVRVYSNATDFSEFAFTLTNTGGPASDDIAIHFTDLTLGTGATVGVDLTSVGAIEVILDGPDGADGTVELLTTQRSTVKTANFLNLEPLAIGDIVWNDLDSDGLFESATESGIDGVTVELFEDSDFNGEYTDTTDTLVDTQTTAGGGLYQFSNLFAGEYVVRIPASNFGTGAPLAMLQNSSTGNLPTPDPDDDVPNDDNGDPLGGLLGFASSAVTLAPSTEPINDGDLDSDTNLNVDFGFFEGVDLIVTQTDSADPADAGGLLVYTLTTTNNGPTTATGVRLTDNLPVNVTFVSATTTHGTVSHLAGVVTANIGTLADQLDAVITVTVRVANSVPGVLSNSVSVTSNETELNATNNTNVEVTSVRPVVDLRLTVADVAGSIDAASAFAYTLTVVNNGPSTATGVVVTDILPSGLTYVSGSATQGSVTQLNGTVTAALGTLANGASATITLNVTVNNSTTGTLTNSPSVTASQTDVVSANNTATVTTPVRAIVDLSLTKVDSADPVFTGGTVTYTLTARNDGPSTATNVVITDTLPDGSVFVSSTTTQGSVTQVAGIVTANLGTLAQAGTATITVTVRANDDAEGVLTNVASVTSSEFETDAPDNTATQPTSVLPVADLVITQVESGDPVNAGGEFKYTLTITNNGPTTAIGAIVTDVLPANLTFVDATSTGGEVELVAGTVVATLDDIDPGDSVEVEINLLVANGASGTLSNTANVTAETTDQAPANNSTTVTTTVRPVVDLVVTTTDAVDPIFVNGTVIYTLVVTNNGPSTATGVTLVDTLPAALTYSSGAATQGTVTQNINGTVSAALGTIASGASATITIIASAGLTTGTFNNTAVVTSTEFELAALTNTDIETTTIAPLVDLRLTTSESPDPVIAGQNLTYTFNVINNGPSTATSVVATDVLPSSLTFVSGNSTQGTVTALNGTVTATLGTLEVGASATITVIVTVASGAPASITNTPSVTSAEADLNSVNNSEAEITTVNRLVNLAITKTDNPDPAPNGGQVTYTLTVTNAGPSDATAVTIADILPNTVNYVSANVSQGSANHSNGTVTAGLGIVPVGSTATMTIVVDLGNSGATSITNTASVTSDETDTNIVNNSVAQPTTVAPQIDLSVEIVEGVDPIVAGNTLTYTLTVRNTGRSTAPNVVVTDTLPIGVTFGSGGVTQGTVSQNAGIVTANLGSLASDATATVTINVTIPEAFSGTLTNAASITSSATDSILTNNTDSETTTVSPLVDLVVTKVDSIDPVNAGASLTYNITVRNQGPSAASNVVLTDPLPADATFVSATTSQGTIGAANGTVTANLGSIPVGGLVTITLNVTVDGDALGQLSNTATVTATEADRAATNNTVTQSTSVQALVDLAIVSVAAPTTALSGGTVTYTITARNNGPSTAHGVIVTDTLHPALTYTTGSSTRGAVTHANNVVTANIGTLDSGAEVTITLTGTIASTFSGELTNTATTTVGESDSNLTNNTIAHPITVGIPQGSLTGRVYADRNSNGTYETTDVLLTNVALQAIPLDANGNISGPAITEFTGTDGVYRFAALVAGRYRLLEIQPDAFAQGTETVGNRGGTNTVENVIETITIGANQEATGYDFSEARQILSIRRYIASTGTGPQIPTSQRVSLSGRIYSDADNDRAFDPTDDVLPNVQLSLVPINTNGTPIGPTLIAVTDFNGIYRFSNVTPGRYRLIEVQPPQHEDSIETIGSAGGTNTILSDDIIDDIVLTLGLNATNYDFIEGLPIR